MGPGRLGLAAALLAVAACAPSVGGDAGIANPGATKTSSRTGAGRGSSSGSKSASLGGSSGGSSSGATSGPGAVGGSSSSGGTSAMGPADGGPDDAGPEGSFCLAFQPSYEGTDAGCGPDGGGAGSEVIDLTDCQPIPGAVVGAIDQDQVQVSGMSATPDPATGDLQVCEDSPLPPIFSLTFNAPTYPTVYGEEQVTFPGHVATETWVALISANAVGSYTSFIPGGVNPSDAIVDIYIATQDGCGGAGWVATLEPWDAGVPDGGYGHPVYLGPTLVPDPSLTSTSFSGAVLFFNVDPSISSFAVATMRQLPGMGGCAAAPPPTLWRTGRVPVAGTAISFVPIVPVSLPTGTLCNGDGPNHWADKTSGCANGGFQGLVDDLSACCGVTLVTPTTLDQNGTPFDTSSTVAVTGASGIACAPPGPVTLELTVAGYAPTFYAEEPAPGAGNDDIAYVSLYSSQFLADIEAPLPTQPDPSTATVISYFPPNHLNHCDPSGWTVTLTPADGGAPIAASYLGTPPAIDTSLTATSSQGVAIFTGVDPSQGPFFTTQFARAVDGGCQVESPAQIGTTGRLFVAPGGVTYEPRYLGPN
jgi:hypothetical protein